MLRRWFTRRIAQNASPLREQREASFAQIPPKGPEEGPRSPEEGPEENPDDVGRIQEEISRKKQEALPEEILEKGLHGDSEDIVNSIVLNVEVEAQNRFGEAAKHTGLLRERGGQGVGEQLREIETILLQREKTLSLEEHEYNRLVELGWNAAYHVEQWDELKNNLKRTASIEFLRDSPLREVLTVLRGLEARRGRYEESVRVIQNVARQVSPAVSEQDRRLLTTLLEEGTLGSPDVEKALIARLEQLPAPPEFEYPDSKELLSDLIAKHGGAPDIAHAVRYVLQKQGKRHLAGLTPGDPREPTPDEEAKRRQSYLEDLTNNIDTMRTYLAARIRGQARERRDAFLAAAEARGYQKVETVIAKAAELKISPVALSYALANEGDLVEKLLTDTIPPAKHSLSDFGDALDRLEKTSWMRDRALHDREFGRLFEHAVLDDRDAQEWMKRELPRAQRVAEVLRTLTDEDLRREFHDEEFQEAFADLLARLQRVAQGAATEDDHNQIYDYLYKYDRDQISVFITTLLDKDLHAVYAQGARDLDAQKDIDPVNAREALQPRLQHVIDTLFPKNVICRALQNEVCAALRIGERLDGMTRDVEQILSWEPRPGLEEKSKDLVRKRFQYAAATIARLEAFCEQLSVMDPDDETLVRDISAEKMKEIGKNPEYNACYRRSDGLIYINTDRVKTPERRKELINHERSHALIDLLTRRTYLFPTLLTEAYDHTRDRAVDIEGKRTSVEELLERLGRDVWKIDLSCALDPEESKEKLMDEALARYGCWVQEGRKISTSPDMRALYEFLETRYGNDVTNTRYTRLSQIPAPDASGVMAQHGEEEFEREHQPQPIPESGSSESGFRDIPQEFRQLERDIHKIRSFIDAHPQFKSDLRDIDARQKEYLDILVQLQNMFQAKHITPEDAGRRIDAFRTVLIPVGDAIQAIDSEELDIANVPAEGKGGLWNVLFPGGLKWMSVFDVINMVRSAKEDILRMWKRRGARTQSIIGERLTGWISDRIYIAGQLKHEYKRRGLASEDEEIHQWKEALKEADSFELLHLLGQTGNKDQIRAMLELLTERGRMDWNDIGFWRTLNRLSKYKMPIESCMRSDVLRDKWLHKLITDIYTDKDHYFNWRRQNDSNITSKKSEFTPLGDQLANLKGGFSGELKRQLIMFTRAKKEHQPIPEAVNPHLYEEILHYAMRNGKETMEAKFFYLIMGVNEGLLSIDRLRVLAGEGGEILNRFPFIDYFYKKNNTLPEINRLAKRIAEHKPDHPDYFDPGPKTMYFLQYEMGREQSTKERISKALGKDNAEKIDHEDIPMIVSQITWNRIDDMAGALSGTRQKITQEGWKNAYLGFTTKFKAFARLAELDEKKVTRFTQEDARQVAVSIASFVHMDNILTGHAHDVPNRPRLSWDEINNTGGPSSGGILTRVYRESAQNLVKDLVDELERQGLFDWSKVDYYVKDKDGKPVKILDAKNEYFKLNQDPDEDETKRKAVRNTTEKFSRELEKAVKSQAGLNVLQRVMRAKVKAGKIIEEGASQLPTGEFEDYLTLEKAEEFVKSAKETLREKALFREHVTEYEGEELLPRTYGL
jgi:hypothetical protein